MEMIDVMMWIGALLFVTFLIFSLFWVILRNIVQWKRQSTRMSWEIFSNVTSSHFSRKIEEVEFCHCKMDGRMEMHRSKDGMNARLRLQPFARFEGLKSKGGLTIDAGAKQELSLNGSDSQHVTCMDEEYFQKHCVVECGGKTIPGSDLPESILQLLRKIGELSCPKFSVYCGPDRFEINVCNMVRGKKQTKEFVAASLLLLKQLVYLKVDGLPTEELKLPVAYDEADFINEELLPKTVREHLNKSSAASEKAGKDPLLNYWRWEVNGWGDAYGTDATDDGIYDRVDGDAGRVREKVIQDDAHALQDGKSRWME